MPYEINPKNLIRYEQIISIKAFQNFSEITIMLEIPLIQNQVYNLYHLYAFPTKINNTYHMIIPEKKFLAISKDYYDFLDEINSEIQPGQYIQSLKLLKKLKGPNQPCEINLLRFSQNYSSCEIITLELYEEKVQKINEWQWIAIFPKPTPIQINCENNEEIQQLYGSYILTIPTKCYIEIKNQHLRSYNSPTQEKKILQLPSIEAAQTQETPKFILNISQPKWKNLELDNFKEISSHLHSIYNNIDSNDNNNFNSYHYITISLYILILLIITCYLYYFCLKRKYYRKLIIYKKETHPEAPLKIENKEIPLEQLELKKPMPRTSLQP